MGHRPHLDVEQLGKRHSGQSGDELVVFEGATFGVEKGELVSVVGHKGCGKSTLLAVIAGLVRASVGTVFVAGREVDRPGHGLFWPDQGLLPWKTALGNVELSVSTRHPEWGRERARAHSLEYLHRAGLRGVEKHRPDELSSSVRQRVGLARAFAVEPAVLLMDDPFAAIDAPARTSLQDRVAELCATARQTVFMITEDVDEALYLSDRILLMTSGPGACIAGQLCVDMPRPRWRAELSHSLHYVALRRRVLEFLAAPVQRLALPERTPPAPAYGLVPEHIHTDLTEVPRRRAS